MDKNIWKRSGEQIKSIWVGDDYPRGSGSPIIGIVAIFGVLLIAYFVDYFGGRQEWDWGIFIFLGVFALPAPIISFIILLKAIILTLIQIGRKL